MADAGSRSGFVGIVGRPNVGKSTILNAFLGEKIAIISPRPQTTRHRIIGVLTRPEGQLVFVDSPGWHKPEHALGRYMVEVTKAVMEEADVLVVVVDAVTGLTAEDRRLLDQLERWASEPGQPAVKPRTAILAINKVDAVRKAKILPIIEAAGSRRLFAACVPISAKTGEQMDVLLHEIAIRLPEGPQWYEPHQRTDQTTEQLVSEFIREQVLLATHQEVPHAVAVIIDSVEERDQVTAVQATILVERPGQKAILIGRKGSMLKVIGSAARRELERLLGRKVFLSLWVKVAEDWRGDDRMLRQLGFGDTP